MLVILFFFSFFGTVVVGMGYFAFFVLSSLGLSVEVERRESGKEEETQKEKGKERRREVERGWCGLRTKN